MVRKPVFRGQEYALSVLYSVVIVRVCGFWLVFPFTTECVRSYCFCAWSVYYLEVKQRKEF
jgi:hypothetical protein